jgi:kinesin family protein 5
VYEFVKGKAVLVVFIYHLESVDDVYKGFNATIFAYGQTGSGKTYTMFGPNWEDNLGH